MLTKKETTIIADAARDLRDQILTASPEDVAELDDHIGDGFPVEFDVEFDGDEIEAITARIGHSDGEWHGMSKTLTELRDMRKGDLLNAIFDSIDVAIENHRDLARNKAALLKAYDGEESIRW